MIRSKSQVPPSAQTSTKYHNFFGQLLECLRCMSPPVAMIGSDQVFSYKSDTFSTTAEYDGDDLDFLDDHDDQEGDGDEDDKF